MSGRWMTAAVVTVVMLASATGCVSKEKFDEARAAAARATEALGVANAQLGEVRRQNQQLRDEIANRDAQLATKDGLIRSLELANADWADKFGRLQKLYDEAIKRDVSVVGPLPPRVDALLKQWARDNPDLVEYFPQHGMVKLKADLLFDVGATDIKPAAKGALKKLADILNTPEAQELHVYAAGHTDDIPLVQRETLEKHGSNWGLSVHRSLAVVKAMFEAGIAQRRMAAMGFSMYHPVAPNAAARKGNALNRRVELWIVPPGKFLTVSTVAPPEQSE